MRRFKEEHGFYVPSEVRVTHQDGITTMITKYSEWFILDGYYWPKKITVALYEMQGVPLEIPNSTIYEIQEINNLNRVIDPAVFFPNLTEGRVHVSAMQLNGSYVGPNDLGKIYRGTNACGEKSLGEWEQKNESK